jgi:fumarate reductase (CoM/CoB) subunit A
MTGIRAAYELRDKGRKVLIANSGRGASPFVHGFNIPLDTSDSAEIFLKDTLKSGYYQNDLRLARKLCADSLEIKNEIEAFGLSFNRAQSGGYELIRPLGASKPRVASIGNEAGVAICAAMEAEMRKKTDTRYLNNIRILKPDIRDGIVVGALGFDLKKREGIYISAQTVIAAGGGYCGIYPFSTNSHDIGGDTAAMLFDAGAALTDMEFVQFEPTVAVYPKAVRGKGIITTLFYEGAVLCNVYGDRFMAGGNGECVEKDVLARAIYNEITSGGAAKQGGVYFDATGVGADVLNQKYPMYVKRYADVGVDITKQPVEVAPAPHTSLGGAIIDEKCASSIGGLFVCGEAAGGIHGANRMGGNAGLETLVFGRQAGRSAEEYLGKNAFSAPGYN